MPKTYLSLLLLIATSTTYIATIGKQSFKVDYCFLSEFGLQYTKNKVRTSIRGGSQLLQCEAIKE